MSNHLMMVMWSLLLFLETKQNKKVYLLVIKMMTLISLMFTGNFCCCCFFLVAFFWLVWFGTNIHGLWLFLFVSQNIFLMFIIYHFCFFGFYIFILPFFVEFFFHFFPSSLSFVCFVFVISWVETHTENI